MLFQTHMLSNWQLYTFNWYTSFLHGVGPQYAIQAIYSTWLYFASFLRYPIHLSLYTIFQESKLNPHAKVFAPSLASSKPVHAAAPPVNPNYISNSVARVPTGIPVFQSHSLPGSSSLPSKVVHYNNLAPGNFSISPQYVQSVSTSIYSSYDFDYSFFLLDLAPYYSK